MRRAVVAATMTWIPLLLIGAEPVDHVVPFIGTGGHGHTYPGATLPFGMVQLSPDTRLEGWDGCSGYHFTDEIVYGFSHTHLSGTGISDYGDVLLMPMTGTPLLDNGYHSGVDAGYASRFEKSSERAEPGYYAVRLADHEVDVELTVTKRAGMHRYRFPVGKPAHVIVDLEHRDRVVESGLRIVSSTEIEGFRHSTGWARSQVVHFVARFSKPFTAVAARDDEPLPGEELVEGENIKAVLSFGDDGGELLVKVGISAVDVAGARRNLETEMAGRGFDEVRTEARDLWNESLGRIELQDGADIEDGVRRERRTIFYTALYHSLIAPNLYSDVDGRYRGIDGQVHLAQDRRHYTVFSLWDTFRATHPLFTLLEPVRTAEFVQTFLAMYEQGGRLPVWELAANETDTMIGYHAIPVIADAWVKGIRDFDGKLALAAMVDSAERNHFGLQSYRRQGFIGSQDDSESVSKTLEYAYDDWCISAMAADLDEPELAREFAERSGGWRHLLDPETGFFRARRNQRWVEPFDPSQVDQHYTEANAWQYGFFVPHDLEGLIEAFGGDEAFVERLDALFEADSSTTGRDQPDITGLIGQYAHGNEPSHHMAWLYHYAGRPGDSAARVRQILQELYTPQPDGLSGNEDCGQMSSWYVLGAIGLYPVCPCTDEYALVPPLFERVTLRLQEGRRFVIEAPGAGDGPAYIRGARLNGQPLERSFLRHGEIAAGGRLVLELGPEPDPQWGVAPANRPRSRVEAGRTLAAPFARSEDDKFRNRLTVELASAEAAAVIRYSLDDGASWTTYEEPLDLRESARVRFVAERDGLRSPEVESYFHRIPNAWSVEVADAPAAQYSAGGKLALVDGLRAPLNWRIGGWHGYRETDFQATVDLGAVQPVRRAGAGFLQDVRSWIWMPAEVTIAVSEDGITFHEVATLSSDVDDRDEEVVIRDLTADLEEIEARYVRVHARSYGTIPDWHPGSGERAWIFVDEVVIE